jgi:uncharacterized protein YjbJ (UPF0337 family)
MSKDIMQDKWRQLRDAVGQRWGALTEKDLDTIVGKLDKLPVLLQARYGYTKEQVEKEIDLFSSDMKLEGKDVIEVVRETLSDSTPGEEAHVQKRAIKE